MGLSMRVINATCASRKLTNVAYISFVISVMKVLFMKIKRILGIKTISTTDAWIRPNMKMGIPVHLGMLNPSPGTKETRSQVIIMNTFV